MIDPTELSDVSVVWNMADEARRLAEEAEARLAGVHLLLGPDSDAGKAADRATKELRAAADNLFLGAGTSNIAAASELPATTTDALADFNQQREALSTECASSLTLPSDDWCVVRTLLSLTVDRDQTVRGQRLGFALGLDVFGWSDLDGAAHEPDGLSGPSRISPGGAACFSRAATTAAPPVASRSDVPKMTSSVLTPIRSVSLVT
jgi:hypothetical protein